VKHLKYLRWAVPFLLVFAPMVWESKHNTFTPRTWLESVAYVAGTFAEGLAIMTVLVFTVAWSFGTFDRKGPKP
jgi:type IV secretory pathway VirB2 component (pilin)